MGISKLAVSNSQLGIENHSSKKKIPVREGAILWHSKPTDLSSLHYIYIHFNFVLCKSLI